MTAAAGSVGIARAAARSCLSKSWRSLWAHGANRPSECQTFSCLWLIDDKLHERWKPNKSKLVLTASEDGIEVRCDPAFPDAWRKEPFGSEIRQWAVSGETNDVTVVVIVNQRMTLVTPEREFDLGAVRPDERIVRELEGTRVVNVSVVKADDLERCHGPG